MQKAGIDNIGEENPENLNLPPLNSVPKKAPNESHPQQTLHVFDTITIDSCFDSGNLSRVDRVKEDLFNLFIAPDNMGTQYEKNYRTFFHFAVTAVKTSGTISFVVKNMNFQQKLFKEGLTPVYKVTTPSNSSSWRRIPHPVTYMNQNDKFFEFEFTFKFDGNPEERVYFAFCVPWSYEENQQYLQECETTAAASSDIFFHRELLIYSREKRRIELVTITSKSGATTEREPVYYTLFPERGTTPRPFVFRKKYVFVSARVHPGEVPGSHVLKGLMDFVLHPTDKRSKTLRENFVFVFVPILNPDGVYRGAYRTDTLGQNLNRYYIKPSITEHPSIYAAREIITSLRNDGRLFMYLDLHAHATKKGCFIFGNSLEFRDQVLTCLFPKLLSMNSEIFDYDGCDFSERNMYAKDKGDGLSKEGSGRVALYKATNLVHCYTLECNYNTGRMTNILHKLANEEEKSGGKLSNSEEITGMRTESVFTSALYTHRAFEELGEGIGASLLDYFDINPLSRLPSSQFKSLRNLKLSMAMYFMRQLPYRMDTFLRPIAKNLDAGLDTLLLYLDKNVKQKEAREPREKEERNKGSSSSVAPFRRKQQTAVRAPSRVKSRPKAPVPQSKASNPIHKLTSLPKIKP